MKSLAICEICKTEFLTYRRTQKYCSAKCARKSEYLNSKNSSQVSYICKNCGSVFHPTKKEYNQYCSLECSRKHSELRICEYCGECFLGAVQNQQRFCSEKCRRKDYKHKHCKRIGLPEKQCPSCGKMFSPQFNHQRLCGSANCRNNYYRLRYLETYVSKLCVCKECGNEFKTFYLNKHRDYCSNACLKKHGSRVGKATRRARIHKASRIDYFDPLEIFKRDRWTCRLCGKTTPKELRGKTDDSSPELDHIIPLALGGSHTKSNVQCLCRKCNQMKGIKVFKQLEIQVGTAPKKLKNLEVVEREWDLREKLSPMEALNI